MSGDVADMQLAHGGKLEITQAWAVGPTGRQPQWGDDAMTTFDEREKGYEKKFAMDADLKFKAESRRN